MKLTSMDNKRESDRKCKKKPTNSNINIMNDNKIKYAS